MLFAAYLPNDRRRALALDQSLPERTLGSALFADISGFTPLTEWLVQTLGPSQGVDELTRQLNRVYDALIAEVDRAGGSVIGFSGDAITCWFDESVVSRPWSVALTDTADVLDNGQRTRDNGQSPARRAVGCALAMQRAMQAFANIEVRGGGRAALALKAAVTSGAARRFLIGDPDIQHLEALVGTPVLRLATAEHLASPGDVVVDADTVAHLAADLQVAEWRVDAATGERFAIATGLENSDPQESDEDELGASGLAQFLALNTQFEKIRPWLLPPVYERLRAGLGEFVTELRSAVALFVKFGGIDYDSAAARVQLDAYVQWVQGVLIRYGGVLLDVTIGDKGSYLYAAFGAPIAHENDAQRAVAVALELRAPPASLGFVDFVQIGLSQGTMRTGAYGSASRRTYGVLGNEVNLAARLMQRAAPGEILISRRVQKLAAAMFALEPLPPVRLKGLPEPVPIFRVAGEQQHTFRLIEPAFVLPMVGRVAELSTIATRLDWALGGQGQVVGITGEAGLGKSRLAAEAIRLAQRRGLRGFGGACQSYGTNTPYLVWESIWRSFFGLSADALLRQQLHALVGAVGDLAPDRQQALPLLGPLLGLALPDNDFTRTLGPRDRKSALEALLLECLRSAAREAAREGSGLLLVLEDLHWIDPASHDLLELVARAIADMPVLIVLAYRPPELLRLQKPRVEALVHFTQISLEALADDEAEQVLRAKLAQLLPERHGPVPPALIEQITARAQGNPFYIEELLNYLHDRGIDLWAADPAALKLPDSLHSLVLSRIDQLSERQKATLKAASVIGRLFRFSWLRDAYPVLGQASALRADLNELAALDLTPIDVLEPELAYLFKHIVTQEVAYESMTTAARGRLHAQLGRYLEQFDAERYVDLLAYHYRRAGVRDKSLHYLDLAARKAQREYANEAALGYYREALALEERWQWRQAEVEALHLLGRRDEQHAALRALEAAPYTPPFTAAYLWGQYYEALGSYPEAHAAAERALDAARAEAHPIDQTRCLALLGVIARRQGEYERAHEWYEAALALFSHATDSSKAEAEALAQALNGLGIVQRQRGDFEAARHSHQQAMRVCMLSGDRRGEADALNNLGTVAYRQRNFADAAPYHRRALEIRQAVGDRVGQGISLLNLALVIRDSGDYSQAQAHLQAALAIQQLAGNRWEEVNIWNDLGILYQELGDLTRAQAYLERGLELSRQIGDESGQAYLLCNLGLVVRDRGDLYEAANILGNGLKLAQAHSETSLAATFFSYLGSVGLQLGQPTQAIAHAETALSMRRALDMRLRTTADLTTLAAAYVALGDIACGLGYAQQALAILEGCGGVGPESPQQDYYTCAQVLAASGQAEAARAALRSAYQLVIDRADRIADPAQRQSFLERVPINRAIVQAVEGNAFPSPSRKFEDRSDSLKNR